MCTGPRDQPPRVRAQAIEIDGEQIVGVGEWTGWAVQNPEAAVFPTDGPGEVDPGPFELEIEGPAVPHLSSGASRSAYAAAGALADAGDARDDDLAWPFDWGRPTPMLVDEAEIADLVERGGYDREQVEAHAPVYGPGTMPAVSDEDWAFPSAPLAECDCAAHRYARERNERLRAILEQGGDSLRGMAPALTEAGRRWTQMIEEMTAALGVPRALVAGTAADPLAVAAFGFADLIRADILARLSRDFDQRERLADFRPTGILTVLGSSSPDDPLSRTVRWNPRDGVTWAGSGQPLPGVTFDEVDWDRVRTATPGGVTVGEWLAAADEAHRGFAPVFDLDHPQGVDTTPRVEIGVDLGPYPDADLVAAIREGDTVTLFRDGTWGGSYRTEALLALRGPQVFRPGRLVTGTIA